MLWITETFENETKGYIFGESDGYETFTDDIGELYRDLRREYGGKVAKMYRDPGRQVGWVFSKRLAYEDSAETYVRNVWVEVFDAKPETTREWNGDTVVTRVQHYPHAFKGAA